MNKYSCGYLVKLLFWNLKRFSYYLLLRYGLFGYWLLEKEFERKKAKVTLRGEVWKNINFKALGLDGEAKILLNPYDEGFSKDFYLYGFREPLNSFAIYKTVERIKPFILDIGSNLGYFPLIELQAGAKHVVAVEPIPLTFNFLSKSLKNFKNVTLLNIAISDKKGTLRLFVSNKFNIVSSYSSLITSNLATIQEILVKADTITSLAKRYPINMVRMDVEGHEYRILAGRIPDDIDTICMELHIIPPFTEADAKRLLLHLHEQGFEARIVIHEMNPGVYPIINYLGLKAAYKLINALEAMLVKTPRIQQNVDLASLLNDISNRSIIHLILQR